MSDNTPIKVVLMWHMHQPEYRDLRIDEYQLPWTYLHGIKDYVDMVAHLEQNSDACAVFNFAPVLLDQIQDYTKQISDNLNFGTPIRDPLLSALSEPVLPCRCADLSKINQGLFACRSITYYRPF